MSKRDLVNNRRAFHDYEIVQKFEAGIALVGTEVKSLRDHHANLSDAYVSIKKDELWLNNASISLYSHGNVHNHEEKRSRKLLMHRHEIEKIKRLIQEKGMTIIPLSIYLKKNHIKVEIGVGKGKKLYDKREALKAKEHKRAVQRAIKGDSA